MIIFNKEIDFAFYNGWKFFDADGDIYFKFILFEFHYYLSGIGITLFNFGFQIYWY